MIEVIEDPLSPFLYLLVAEGLCILTTYVVELDLFEPVVLGSDNIKTLHLQYADDTVFMGAATLANARTMKYILKTFEMFLGLKINYS